MTISTICLIVAMVIIPLLTESNYRTIRGYIIFDSIDIHCEIQAVPFAQLAEAIGYRNLDRGDWAERGVQYICKLEDKNRKYDKVQSDKAL